MAQTTTSEAELTDLRLESVAAYLGDLPILAEQWDALDDGSRAGESLDWDHYVADYLPNLEWQYHSGQMTPDQEARYRALLAQLRASLLLLRQLRFWVPTIPSQAR